MFTFRKLSVVANDYNVCGRRAKAFWGGIACVLAAVLPAPARAAGSVTISSGYFTQGIAQYNSADTGIWAGQQSHIFQNMTEDTTAIPTNAPYYVNQVVSQPVGFTDTTVVFGQVNDTNAFNSVTFTKNSAIQTGISPGDEIKLGTLTFSNGLFDGKWVDLTLSVQTSSTDPLLNGHSLSETVRIVMTGGLTCCDPTGNLRGLTPDEGADWLYFPSFPGMGSMRVYESFDAPPGKSNVGIVDLYATIGSLIPAEFRNPTGGAFLDASVTDALSTAAVPEPETYALLLAGLGLLGLSSGRRKQKIHASTI